MSTQEQAPTTSSTPKAPKALVWTVITGVCAVIVLIGSFLPWAHVADITLYGMDNDGRVTLVLSVLAIFFALWGTGRIGIGGHRAVPLSLLVACMAIIAIVGIADVGDVQDDTRREGYSAVRVAVAPGVYSGETPHLEQSLPATPIVEEPESTIIANVCPPRICALATPLIACRRGWITRVR